MVLEMTQSSLSSTTHIVDAVIVPMFTLGRIVIFLALDFTAILAIILVVLLLAVLLFGLIKSVLLAIIRGILAVITVLAILGVTRVPEFGFTRSSWTIVAVALANLHFLAFLVTFECAVAVRNFVSGTLGPGTVGSQGRCCHHDR